MPFKANKPETIARVECQMFRDYCASVFLLMEQFLRFERSGTLSHPTLQDLLGEMTNRGPLWRLKDAGHILFSKKESFSQQLLDRTFGSIFHEALKLMEATYQSQHYANACKHFASQIKALSSSPQAQVHNPGIFENLEEDASYLNFGSDLLQNNESGLDRPAPALNTLGMSFAKQQALLADVTEDLLTVLEDSTGDVKRGIKRLRTLIESSRPLICLCLAGKGDNPMLARYLEGRAELIRQVLGNYFDDFVAALKLQASSSTPAPLEHFNF